MNPAICAFCDAGRPAIFAITSGSLPVCERCYGKMLEKDVVWTAETTKAEILQAMRARAPLLQASVAS